MRDALGHWYGAQKPHPSVCDGLDAKAAAIAPEVVISGICDSEKLLVMQTAHPSTSADWAAGGR